MQARKCPICEFDIEIGDKARVGERFTCPNCFAQLAVYKHKNLTVLGCAVCKEENFNPENCENCERLLAKRKLLEEGRL